MTTQHDIRPNRIDIYEYTAMEMVAHSKQQAKTLAVDIAKIAYGEGAAKVIAETKLIPRQPVVQGLPSTVREFWDFVKLDSPKDDRGYHENGSISLSQDGPSWLVAFRDQSLRGSTLKADIEQATGQKFLPSGLRSRLHFDSVAEAEAYLTYLATRDEPTEEVAKLVTASFSLQPATVGALKYTDHTNNGSLLITVDPDRHPLSHEAAAEFCEDLQTKLIAETERLSTMEPGEVAKALATVPRFQQPAEVFFVSQDLDSNLYIEPPF